MTGGGVFMADVFTKHAASLASLEVYMGAGVGSFLWNSVDYPCLASGNKGGKLLGEGGYRVTAQIGIAVRSELFADGLIDGAKPQEKQTIVFTSRTGAEPRTLRIDSITEISDKVMILDCNDPNEGA